MLKMNRLSKIFQPIVAIPKNATIKNQDITSKSQRLMLELGIIRQGSSGNFHFLPLGLKALENLIHIVDYEMNEVGAQKLIFPTLTNTKLWEKTGRINDVESELFKLHDRHNKNYILSPTHEEAVTDLLASIAPLSYKHFPLRLYQITSKYRDEMKPRFGLMRARQFFMKDLYTFDVTLQSARETYDDICNSYHKIFNKIGIDCIKVLGTTGNIGGLLSHEYHFVADIGEDRLLQCTKCDYASNIELCHNQKCPNCGDSKHVKITNGIEVGHTFLLGDKYTKPLNAQYLATDGKFVTLQMGCYGLGVSRILAAAIEVLSLEQEIRWPFAVAPYKVIIITPKKGSKEEYGLSTYPENLYNQIELLTMYKNGVLIDDRTHMTIGKRHLEAKRVGYPYIIVIGTKILENPPLFELNDLVTNNQHFFTEHELINYLNRNK